MKRFLILFMIVAVALVSISCEDEYLEPERATNVITDQQLAEAGENNPAILEGNLEGIVGFMIDDFGTQGDAAGRHYDIGQKGVDIWTDITCGDAALSASAFGWYNSTANLLTQVDFTFEENEIIWTYYFRIISVANSIIETSGGNNPETDDPEILRVNAQAKSFRAYAYFYLTQIFQREYNPSEPILPFFDGENNSFAKVEASQIYELMVNDLTFAVTNLDGYTRGVKSQIDQTVAQGLLAYVYGAMGDYENAKIQAEDVINSGAYPLLTRDQLAFPGEGSGFNEIAPSWVWGFDITADLGHQLINWWGQMDFFTYSYAWAGDTKSIDDALYDQIPDNDIRKTQFDQGAQALQPVNKFFAPDRTPGGQFQITTDYIFMRIEEFYLLSAEASAQMGDEAAAKSRLVDLLSIRFEDSADATSYVNQFSGQDLINEIYFQTRAEFWGEGKSYLAMKRNKATVTRGTNHVFKAEQSFSHNSDEMSFQIPEVEIINNPDISSQN